MNRKKKKGSNYAIFIFLGVIVLLIAAIMVINGLEKENPVYNKKPSDLNPATRSQLNDPNYQNIILPGALDEKIKNEEDFVVYMFASTCRFCQETTPDLMKLADELNVHIDQMNLAEFPELQRTFQIEYTPTLVYFENGVEKERLVGGLAKSGPGLSLNDFRDFLERSTTE